MQTFHPTGIWQGTKQLWLHPEAEVQRSEARIEVTPETIAYTWSYAGRPQEGVMRLLEEDGQVVIDWTDTFHATDGMRFVGSADAEKVVVLGSYSDGQGGPDWGWRIEVSLGGVPVVRMFNITPDGIELLAVDLRAEA